MVDPTTLQSLDVAIANWVKSIQYMQRFQATGDSIVSANPTFAKSPQDYSYAISNAQRWLEYARAAKTSGDPGAIRAAIDTARNAWRTDPATLNALRQGATAIVPQVAPAVEATVAETAPLAGEIAAVVESTLPTMGSVVSTVQTAVPAIES